MTQSLALITFGRFFDVIDYIVLGSLVLIAVRKGEP
jgi:hypothetical protein